MDYLHQFGLAFMAFFAIMNPVSSLPVYISLTAGDDEATAKAVARKGLLIAFGIIVVFALGGRYIFEMFGMTLPALRLAGGAEWDDVTAPESWQAIVADSGHKPLMAIVSAAAPKLRPKVTG